MAIAYDTGNSNYSASGPASFALTAGAANELAVIFVWTADDPSQNKVTSVTVNAVAATFVTKIDIGNNQCVYSYYYVNPPTSSVTYQANRSDSSDIEIHAQLYSGIDTVSQPDSSNSGTNTTSLTLSTTVVASNCWLVSACRNRTTGTATAGTGTTQRLAGTAFQSGDSNGTVGTGAQTMTWDGSASNNLGGIIFSIDPAITTSIKTIDGLAIASVKTVDGLAIASVKTVDGLA